jgi:hypothetical protein
MKVNPASESVIVRAIYNSPDKSDRVRLETFDTPEQADLFLNAEMKNNQFLGAVVRQRGLLLNIVV